MQPIESRAQETARWLRQLASHVDYTHFRKAWLHPITKQAEQGYLAAVYERVARRANSEGEYFLAYDAAEQGLRCATESGFPTSVLTALKATALARSGATMKALELIDQHIATLGPQPPDSSIGSAKARILRDIAFRCTDPAKCRALFLEAADWAATARTRALCEGADWTYPANQEALFRFLAGDHAPAHAGAAALIHHFSTAPDSASMWSQTSLAEMHLILGNLDAAGNHYRAAAQQGTSFPGDVAANRAVASILLTHLARSRQVNPALIEEWFPKPVLTVFAGHLPDRADRPSPRLPEAICRPGGTIGHSIAARLSLIQPHEAICATAPGGDTLFSEAVLAAGVHLTIVEPFQRTRITEVAHTYGLDWPARLHRIYEAAMRTEAITCAEDADEESQCEYANSVLLGTAMLRAQRINARLHALVLWDESSPSKRGGTGQFVSLCRQAGVTVEILNPHHLAD